MGELLVEVSKTWHDLLFLALLKFYLLLSKFGPLQCTLHNTTYMPAHTALRNLQTNVIVFD